MAKKITILENAVETSVSKVAKIKTKLANGRDCYWVPEEDYPLGVLNVTEDGVYNASSDPNGPFYGYSEVNVEGVGNVEMGTLGTITITANGTYEAATDSQGPFYGYSTVIVNVSDEDAQPDHISGKDPDGNDEVVTVDDDGHLVKETVPSSIKIISPPDILTYYDGELIDFHGIYVKGYLEDGTEWGVVPNNELSFPEPIAEYDEETYVEGGKYATSDLDTSPFTQPIPFEYSFTIEAKSSEYTEKFVYETNFPITIYPNGPLSIKMGHAADSKENVAGTITHTTIENKTGAIVENKTRDYDPVFSVGYTYNKKTVYYTSYNYYYTQYLSVSVSGIEFVNTKDDINGPAAWTLIYGDIESASSGSTQTIPIQWHRPGDGKSLYDNFEITVIKPDDSGGQDPQPAPTPSPD